MTTSIGGLAMGVIKQGVHMQMRSGFCQAPNCGVEFECEHLYVPAMSKSYPTHDKCSACRGIPEKLESVKHAPVFDPLKIERQWAEKSKGFESYTSVDINRLPTTPTDLRTLAKTWTPKREGMKPGLLLIGGTGTAKTMTTFAIAEKQFYFGRTVHLMNPQKFAAEFGHPDTAAQQRPKAMLMNCDILVFDDLTQTHWTPNVGKVMYEIVEARYASGKSIIASTNYRNEEFLEHMPKDHGIQIMRRLASLCEIVKTGEGVTQDKLPF